MLDAITNHDLGRAGLVYREIKRRITDLQYQPGDRLSEARLAEELGIGRSPVRTAFARLQGEGWIEISPQSGTFVRGLSDLEITEILETRVMLETYMAGRAASRISDAELERLANAFAAYGKRSHEKGLQEYLDLDLQFHAAVYEAGDNSLIRGILTNMIDKVLWIRRRGAASPARLQAALREIQAVFRALQKRDAAAAEKAMRKHIQSSIDFRKLSKIASGKKSSNEVQRQRRPISKKAARTRK
ncbi:MAG: GntR family transcriptional regulator [Afipia sp.]|nr:GntR family transcriptional regulator [Afipia sp.]